MIGIDTNVFVYAVDVDSKFHQRARTFLENRQDSFVVPYKVLVELIVVLSKLGVSRESILREVNVLLDEFIVVFPNWHTVNILQEFYTQYSAKGNRIHDLDIAATCLSNGISRIATFNVRDFHTIKEVEVVAL